jgi:Tol biopolymer transport system component
MVRTSDGKVLARYKNGLSSTFAALSNDGAWLAVVAHSGRYHGNLVVLNLSTKNWSNLGPIVAHPFQGWDYIKSSWNPWFKDSSHLAFVSQGSVVVATPDGKQKKTLSKLQAPAGLAAPSPDGTQVAYVTFAKLPNEVIPQTFGPSLERRPNPAFWGDAQVWVVSVEKPGEPKPVTSKNPDTIYTLRWLNEKEVIFDRLKDRPFTSHRSHARLWRAVVPREVSKNPTK